MYYLILSNPDIHRRFQFGPFYALHEYEAEVEDALSKGWTKDQIILRHTPDYKG